MKVDMNPFVTITLRKKSGCESSEDIQVGVQERTFDYLMNSQAPEIRVSAYLEKDLPLVDEEYAELFVASDCPFRSSILQVIPGSRTRKVSLPGEMKAGEQLVIIVERTPLSTL